MNLSEPGASLLGGTEAALLLALSRLTRGISGRHAARLARVSSQMTSQRSLDRLVALGLVESMDAKPAKLYTLNRAHVLWGPVQQILRSPALVEKEIAGFLAERVGASAVTVALFGSVARQTSTAESDIDLVIVSSMSVDSNTLEVLIDDLHEYVTKMTGNELQVFNVSEDELHQMVLAQDPLVSSWRADAKTILGRELRTLLATGTE